MTAATVENPYAGQGSVLLDIGGDVGAVVVSMPEASVGQEIEIRPLHGGAAHAHGSHGDHGHSHHPHVAVVPRPVEGGLLPSLVFPEVLEGRYGLHPKGAEEGAPAVLDLDVRGGAVTTLAWPAG